MPLIPRIDGSEDWHVDVEVALAASEVVTGRWQPSRPVLRMPPSIEPVVEILEPAFVKVPAGTRHDDADTAVVEKSTTAQEAAADLTDAQTPAAAEQAAAIPSTVQRRDDRAAEPELSAGVTATASHPGADAPPAEPTQPAGTDTAAVNERAAQARAATRLGSGALDIRKAEARDALAAGDPRQAYRLLRRDIAAGARDAEFLGLLALAAISSGRPGEALVVYRRLTLREPENVRWWAGIALCRERLGLDARRHYEAVLELALPGSALAVMAEERLRDVG